MCGDLDEDGPSGAERLLEEFAANARRLLAQAVGAPAADARHAYMDRLFADALRKSLDDGERRGEAAMLDQAIVFARLCGFLAGHAALREDPLRATLDALMAGYAEAQEGAAESGSEHARLHGHDHSH
jgi:hypothetical protein